MISETKKVKRIIAVVLLAGILLIPQVSFAGVTTASSIGKYFIRTTGNEAEAYMYATFLSPRKVVSKVSLEEAPEGTTNFTTVEGPYKRTVYNTTSISRLNYFELEEGYEYRVKYEVTDTLEGIETTVTEYAYLQDAAE